MAHGVWNAGFSRLSPPQAGGGANLITRAGSHARNANTQFSRAAGRARTRNQRPLYRDPANARLTIQISWSPAKCATIERMKATATKM